MLPVFSFSLLLHITFSTIPKDTMSICVIYALAFKGVLEKKSQARCFPIPDPEARMKPTTISSINEIFTNRSFSSLHELGFPYQFTLAVMYCALIVRLSQTIWQPFLAGITRFWQQLYEWCLSSHITLMKSFLRSEEDK